MVNNFSLSCKNVFHASSSLMKHDGALYPEHFNISYGKLTKLLTQCFKILNMFQHKRRFRVLFALGTILQTVCKYSKKKKNVEFSIALHYISPTVQSKQKVVFSLTIWESVALGSHSYNVIFDEINNYPLFCILNP